MAEELLAQEVSESDDETASLIRSEPSNVQTAHLASNMMKINLKKNIYFK